MRLFKIVDSAWNNHQAVQDRVTVSSIDNTTTPPTIELSEGLTWDTGDYFVFYKEEDLSEEHLTVIKKNPYPNT